MSASEGIQGLHLLQDVYKRQEDTLSNVSLETLQSVLDSDAPKFISIGRFSPEKGHKRLLDAFEQYWKEHPDTWLIIIGGVGNLYDETLAHTRALRASDHIILIRAVTNPMPILKRCDLFLSLIHISIQLIVAERQTIAPTEISISPSTRMYAIGSIMNTSAR